MSACFVSCRSKFENCLLFGLICYHTLVSQCHWFWYEHYCSLVLIVTFTRHVAAIAVI